MKFRVNGQVLDADGMRVGEICEAEKFLGVEADGGLGARTAVALFVALRRAEPDKPPLAIADDVMTVELESFEQLAEEPAGPPAQAGGPAESEAARDDQQTSGVLRSVSLG